MDRLHCAVKIVQRIVAMLVWLVAGQPTDGWTDLLPAWLTDCLNKWLPEWMTECLNDRLIDFCFCALWNCIDCLVLSGLLVNKRYCWTLIVVCSWLRRRRWLYSGLLKSRLSYPLISTAVTLWPTIRTMKADREERRSTQRVQTTQHSSNASLKFMITKIYMSPLRSARIPEQLKGRDFRWA